MRGVLGQRRPELAALAGRLLPSGGGAGWATISGQRRSQLSADPLGGVSDQMNAASYLSTIAEVTATFVGFAAILLILLPAMHSDLAGFSRLNITAFLSMGVATVVFSLLPGLLATAPLSEELRWAVASLALGGGSFGVLAWYSARRRRLAGQVSQIRSSFYLLRAGVSAGLSFLVLLSPFLVPLPYQPFIYCSAVTWLLAQLGFLLVLWWINMGEDDPA